jgi:CRISPR-associated protein Cas1
MLHVEAVRALSGAGLDPAIGFFHELSYARESLACDLVEAFRPRVDLWVVRLFNRQVLRMDHFGFDHERHENGACLMTKAGRERFYPAWDVASRTWRRGMRRIAATWARQVLDALGRERADGSDHAVG